MLEIGAAFPLEDSARVLVSVVDEDTIGRLEDGGVSLTNYKVLLDWICFGETRLRSWSSGRSSQRGPDAKVYNMAETAAKHKIHTPEPASRGQTSDAGSRLDTFWSSSSRMLTLVSRKSLRKPAWSGRLR